MSLAPAGPSTRDAPHSAGSESSGASLLHSQPTPRPPLDTLAAAVLGMGSSAWRALLEPSSLEASPVDPHWQRASAPFAMQS